VRWLREQSYINVQSIQPVKFTEFVRKAPGTFYVGVLGEVEAALKRWPAFNPLRHREFFIRYLPEA
jgi:hypothetical protein